MINTKYIGLFKSRRVIMREDNYGGNFFRTYNYIYIYIERETLCIFDSYEKICIPGYDKEIMQSFDDKITLQHLPKLIANARKIKSPKIKNNHAVINTPTKYIDINGNYVEDKEIFQVHFLDNILKVKVWGEKDPNTLWIDDDFEKVDIDYMKLEKQVNPQHNTSEHIEILNGL